MSDLVKEARDKAVELDKGEMFWGSNLRDLYLRLADALEAARREIAILARDVDSEFLRNQELRAQLEAAEKVCAAARPFAAGGFMTGTADDVRRLRDALAAWEKTRDVGPIPDPPLTRSEAEQIREIDRKMKRR